MALRSLQALCLAGSALLAVTTAGCATYSDKTYEARAALQHGDMEGGVKEFNRYLRVRAEKNLPKKWKKNTALAILERGMVLQGLRTYGLSARDFEVADKELELLDIAKDTAGKIGQYIYSDSAPKYKTSPTEKLSLNAMNMVNYLAVGDLNGAKVEAKRFTVMRKYLRDYDPEHEHGAFGSYLAGFVFERLGEADTALRYYDEALQERDLAGLRRPIVRLARTGSYRGERIKAYIPEEQAASAGSPVSEILVIIKTGRVPYKEPRRIPIGAALGIAAAFVTGDTTLLEYGMFKVVTYPQLVDSGSLFDRAGITLDGKPASIDLVTDLTSEIVREYEEIKPKIIGAALTRMIARAAAAEGARAAGRQAEGGAGALVGFLAAAAVEGTLVALDKPDTRSWTTLPAQVHIARAEVSPGAHRVVVTVSGPRGSQTHTTDVNVPAGGFVVLDVTTLR